MADPAPDELAIIKTVDTLLGLGRSGEAMDEIRRLLVTHPASY
jgi:hypothetical protein